MLIACDIDGTVANLRHRLNFIQTKPKNWDAFDAAIPYDTVNEPVATVVKALVATGEHDFIFVSGRNERCRVSTEEWLADNQFWYEKLYMRKLKDYRRDDIVKSEILDRVIEDWGKKPDMVFDDRRRVVEMWHERGVFCFNVLQGFKDF